MLNPHANQFVPFGHEASDSDDSGYAEDDSEASAGDHVDHVAPTRTLEQANQARWPVIHHRGPAETTHRSGIHRPRQNPVWRTEQTLGAIVRHVDLHHFPKGNAPKAQGGDVVNLRRDGQVLAKRRYFLVVGRAGNTIIECPIFTYGGKGLSGRRRNTWHEYCSIRSLDFPVEGFINQSPDNKVLDAAWEEDGFQVERLAVVRLSELRFRHDNTGITLSAGISSEALQYAARRVIDLMSEAVMTARQ